MSNFFVPHLLSITSFILTLVFVSSILRAKRPSGSTVAWLLIILLSPYIGIPLYLFLGDRKISTRLARKRSLFSSKPTEPHKGHSQGIQGILSASNIPAQKENRSIDIITNGEERFSRYLRLINGAKKSIYITTFIFANDSVGQALIDALSKKAAAGLDVRILVDSLGALLLRYPSFRKYKKSGGKVAFFMPMFHLPDRKRSNLRNHRKLMVIDGLEAILGGVNLANEYMGPSQDVPRWVDLSVEVTGPCVDDLQDIFYQDWIFATNSPEEDWKPKESEIEKPTGHLAQVIASGPDVVGDPLYDVLLSSIFSATREILIVTPYFIPDESLAKSLELSAKRGVIVKVLLPRHSNHFLADMARGSFIRQLQSVGVEFNFYADMIHAKAVLIDRNIGFLGSANFDMRSLLLNYELGLLIFDKTTLELVRDWFESCLIKSNQKYSRETFIRQVAEGAGRVIGPFI